MRFVEKDRGTAYNLTIKGNTAWEGPQTDTRDETDVTTAGAGTLTAANLFTQKINRDPTGADRTDTTATAALIIAGSPGLPGDGDSFQCWYRNTADADEVALLAGGTGVTVRGDAQVHPGEQVLLSFIRDSSTTVSLYVLHMGGPLDERGRVTIATAGAGTITAAGIARGFVTRDPAGGNRADTTDTAANIIAAMGLSSGDRFWWMMYNSADAAETSTLTGGTDVTILDGSAGSDIAVAQYYSVRFECIVNSATTIVMIPFLSAA